MLRLVLAKTGKSNQEEYIIERFGVDIGGVLAAKVGPDGGKRSFKDPDFMNIPEVPGAIAAVSLLASLRFGPGNIFIVSKADSAEEEDRRRLWLLHRGFFKRTGIPEANLRFCRQRWEKGILARGSLHLGGFVDNKPESVVHMVGVVDEVFLLNPSWAEIARFPTAYQARRISSWQEITDYLLE
jgi:hypothetical protein